MSDWLWICTRRLRVLPAMTEHGSWDGQSIAMPFMRAAKKRISCNGRPRNTLRHWADEI